MIPHIPAAGVGIMPLFLFPAKKMITGVSNPDGF